MFLPPTLHSLSILTLIHPRHNSDSQSRAETIAWNFWLRNFYTECHHFVICYSLFLTVSCFKLIIFHSQTRTTPTFLNLCFQTNVKLKFHLRNDFRKLNINFHSLLNSLSVSLSLSYCRRWWRSVYTHLVSVISISETDSLICRYYTYVVTSALQM